MWLGPGGEWDWPSYLESGAVTGDFFLALEKMAAVHAQFHTVGWDGWRCESSDPKPINRGSPGHLEPPLSTTRWILSHLCPLPTLQTTVWVLDADQDEVGFHGLAPDLTTHHQMIVSKSPLPPPFPAGICQNEYKTFYCACWPRVVMTLMRALGWLQVPGCM